ncbi:MAG: thrombospondin type 3 repeat-containing protein [Pseudomonadota bacterium]
MRPDELKHAGHGLLAVMVAFLFVFSLLRVSCLLNTAGEGERTVTPGDKDNDTIDDNNDNCDNRPNVVQVDWNNNGIGDVCELSCPAEAFDDDNDGIPDVIDLCDSEQNRDAQTNTDCRHLGDSCREPGEGDIAESHRDHCDNCPLIMNQGQKNADCDDVGDACEDPDSADTLGVRMVIVKGYFYGDRQDFTDPWIELFNAGSPNPWTCFGNMDCSGDELISPRPDGADEPGFAVVPGYYHSRLLSAKSCGAIAIIEFNERLDRITEGEATAGLVARLVTAGDSQEPKSWLYCGLGRRNGEDVLLIKSRHGDCTSLDCMTCEGSECYQGEEVDYTVLPEDVQLTNRNEDDDPVWYPLQIIRDANKVKCFLRSRFYYGDPQKDIIARIEAPYGGTMDSLIGLRTDGVKVKFQAVSLYRF